LYLGKVFGFQSSVLGHVSAPRQLTFLSYPISVEQINLRKHERIACTLPVTFGFSAFDRKGMISDLSCGGCRINSKIGKGNNTGDPFQVGDTIEMSFPQLGMESDVNLNGIIRNINQKDTLIIFGVQFDGTHTEAIDKIKSYINMVNNATIDD
jgi:hypothetical protein